MMILMDQQFHDLGRLSSLLEQQFTDTRSSQDRLEDQKPKCTQIRSVCSVGLKVHAGLRFVFSSTWAATSLTKATACEERSKGSPWPAGFAQPGRRASQLFQEAYE